MREKGTNREKSIHHGSDRDRRSLYQVQLTMSSAGQTSPCAIDRDHDTSDTVLQRNRSALETTLDPPMRWNRAMDRQDSRFVLLGLTQ